MTHICIYYKYIYIYIVSRNITGLYPIHHWGISHMYLFHIWLPTAPNCPTHVQEPHKSDVPLRKNPREKPLQLQTLETLQTLSSIFAKIYPVRESRCFWQDFPRCSIVKLHDIQYLSIYPSRMKHGKLGTKWRFLAGKIIELYGWFSSKPCLITRLEGI